MFDRARFTTNIVPTKLASSGAAPQNTTLKRSSVWMRDSKPSQFWIVVRVGYAVPTTMIKSSNCSRISPRSDLNGLVRRRDP